MSYAGLYLKHYSLGVGLLAYIVESGKAILADNRENRHCLLSQLRELYELELGGTGPIVE